MKRPEQHEIDSQARRLFQSFLPEYLVYREQGEDYGIDAEIEVFKEGESTGLVYKLQIKGTQNPSYLSQTPHISFNFEVNRAEYLINQIKIPVAIILCDLKNKKVFWHAIQIDSNSLTSFKKAVEDKNDSFNIRFGIGNLLPETLDKLLESLAASGQKIALELCNSLSAHHYKKYVDGSENLDREILKLKEKIEIAGSAKINQLIISGEIEEAKSRIEAILVSHESTTTAKFDSSMKLESIFARGIKGSPTAELDLIEFNLSQSQRLIELTSNAEPFYQLLAQAFYLSAKIREQCKEDFDLFTNWSHHNNLQSVKSAGFESIWHSLLPNFRSVAANKLLTSLHSISEMLKTATDNEFWIAYVFIADRFINSMGSFFKRVQFEKAIDQNAPIFLWIEECLETAIKIVDAFKIEDARDSFYSSFATSYLLLANPFDEIDFKNREHQSLELIKRITDDRFRAKKMELIKNNFLKMKEVVVPDPDSSYDIEVIRHHFIAQAHSLGILKPKGEETAEDLQNRQIFEIGLRDLDPTQYFSNCRYLFAEYFGAMGIPAKMLGLYTAGMKNVGCVKHLEHGLFGSWEIKDAYENFHSEHCLQCPDKSPHPSIWKFTTKWQDEMRKNVKNERQKRKLKHPLDKK
jgi:hypothetical protein